jgi:hypothetical protein
MCIQIYCPSQFIIGIWLTMALHFILFKDNNFDKFVTCPRNFIWLDAFFIGSLIVSMKQMDVCGVPTWESNG